MPQSNDPTGGFDLDTFAAVAVQIASFRSALTSSVCCGQFRWDANKYVFSTACGKGSRARARAASASASAT